MAVKFDWTTLIPGYGIYRMGKNFVDNVNRNGFQVHDLASIFGFQTDIGSSRDLSTEEQILGYTKQARDEFLADRAHTEAREDTAYQRGVADMKAAGLSPYTIGASPSPSSSSSVGASSIETKLQTLGYILNLRNLSVANQNSANQAIGNIIKIIR